MLNLQIEVPGTEIWSLNQGGIIEDPVQLADGRWSTLFTVDALALQVFPEEFKIKVGYDNDDTGRQIPICVTECPRIPSNGPCSFRPVSRILRIL